MFDGVLPNWPIQPTSNKTKIVCTELGRKREGERKGSPLLITVPAV